MSIPFDPPRPRPSGGGGGGAFTPVVYNGAWTEDFIVAFGTPIIPDTVRIQEGIDAGYGMSATRTSSYASFLVSESMAGLYMLSIYFCSKRPTSNSGATNWLGFDVGFKLAGESKVGLQSAAGHTGIWDAESTKVPETNLYIVRLPAESELLIAGFSGCKITTRNTLSIVKLSD